MHLSVMIVAAGSSIRMGFDKLAAPLAGMPVLQHTLNRFLSHPAVHEIVLVCPHERFVTLDIRQAAIPVRAIAGGTQRQHSVANGLTALSSAATHVVVHDGARPLLHRDDLDRCLAAALTEGAAALARRVTETLKRSDADNLCTDSISRDNLWYMETPQVFSVPLLRQAYASVMADHLTVTDEVSAVQQAGHPIRFVESRHPNPKITLPADLSLAEALLATR